MKHLKKWRLLYFFIACFVLGFLTMPLFHSGYFGLLWRSFTTIKWYFQILLFLATFFITLALHELAHFVSFLISGYKNELIIILFLVFYKIDDKWKLKIDFKLLLLGGGLVFPDLGDIADEKDFVKARKAMQTSLLAAPLFTLISSVLFLTLTFIFFYTNTFLVPFSLYTFLFSMLYTYTSTKETSQIFGDFKAYKKVKTDDNFATVIVSQYASSIPDYQIKMMKDYLNNQNPIGMDLISKSYFAVLLDMALFQKNEIDYFILEKCLFYSQSIMSFSRLLSNPINYELAQSIIFYLNRLNYKKEAEKLLNLFLVTLENSKSSPKAKEYLTKQTNHILGLEVHSEFLDNPHNINKGFLSFITKNIPSFLESEKHKNSGYEEIKPSLPIIHI